MGCVSSNLWSTTTTSFLNSMVLQLSTTTLSLSPLPPMASLTSTLINLRPLYLLGLPLAQSSLTHFANPS
ncbi:hypothetical protein K1719_012062 [Acacia pycnantha]|nr:hypothetical protein K1719_012062 [Acacia pycnantha]